MELTPTTYAFLADLVAVSHGFVMIIMVLCYFLKVPSWVIVTSFLCALIAILGYFSNYGCVLSRLEMYFREKANQEIFEGSFIVHYCQKIFGFEMSQIAMQVITHFIGITLCVFFLVFIQRLYKRKVNIQGT